MFRQVAYTSKEEKKETSGERILYKRIVQDKKKKTVNRKCNTEKACIPNIFFIYANGMPRSMVARYKRKCCIIYCYTYGNM